MWYESFTNSKVVYFPPPKKFYSPFHKFFLPHIVNILCMSENRFWTSKFDFFKILQTFKVWFLLGLDGFRGVVSTLKPFYHTTHWFWEKSIFWPKNDTFWLQSLGGKKRIFWVKKSIFLKISVWCDKTALRSKQHP